MFSDKEFIMSSTLTFTAARTRLVLAGAAFVLSAGMAQAADVAKVTVNGMVCAFCAQGIEKTIAKMPETKAVYVNLEQKLVAVEPKDGMKLDMKKIAAGITDAGYDVVKSETVSGTTVAAIKADMKAKK
jgi:copper chaperone CopZ